MVRVARRVRPSRPIFPSAYRSVRRVAAVATFGNERASEQTRTRVLHHMAQQRSGVKVARLNPAVAWTAAFTQAAGSTFAKTGTWAVTTAQKSAAVLAVLMGPAVLSVYAFAFWSLTSEMGWTDSFPFSSGPLSNWIIWAALAAAVHSASVILRKQKDRF